MNVQLVSATIQPELTIAQAARLCYSDPTFEQFTEQPATFEEATALIQKLRSIGHESPFEHAQFNFIVMGISRAASHQLVRHRLASYCLAGTTEVVSFRRRKSHPSKKWTLEQLHSWSSDSKRKSRLSLIRLRSVDANGLIVPGKVKSIVNSGKQELFELTTRCGRKIRATALHRFLTPSGWKQLDELAVGDKVVANGLPAYKNKEWLEEMYLHQNMERPAVAKLAGVSDACIGQWIRKFELQKPRSLYPNRQPGHGKSGMFSEETRQLLSLQKTGDASPSWKGDAATAATTGYSRVARAQDKSSTCEVCGAADGVERHHLDKDPLNNEPDNTLDLCVPCHKAHHHGQSVLAVYSTPIVSIEPVGVSDTYDIEMSGPHYNFVADGVVVHNSQQSQRYVRVTKPSVIKPRSIREVPGYSELFDEKIQEIYALYQEMVDAGIPAEDARYILPNAAETKISLSMNARELFHFFKLRCCNRAQWEIRAMAIEMLRILQSEYPVIFNRAGPGCVSGLCPEGAMTCNHPWRTI